MPGSSSACPECGALLPDGGSCRDNFYALLALESQVAGAAGGLPHFYAIACYGIQHPDTMGYTVEAWEGLRTSVAAALAGATVAQLRERARAGSKSARVVRHDGDPVPTTSIDRWEYTVADVLGGGVEGYAEHVETWARSIVRTLEPR